MFSTILSNCADSAQSDSPAVKDDNHCALVETENLVSTSHRSSSRTSHSSSKKTDNIRPCNRKSHSKCKLELDCMYYFGKTLREKGISREVRKILAAGLRESTKKTYQYFIKRYIIYCHTKGWHVVDKNIRHILSFLSHLFHVDKLAFNSINVAKSAISTLLFHDCKLGEDTLISRFMRGVYNLRPFIPKNVVIWDTKKVLDFLEKWHPAKNLSLRQLGIKTVLLCLLVSGQRGQTIHLMCLENLKFYKDKITCAIGDPTKTTNVNNHTK